MADGLDISSGIGTGEAQIIQPFQSPVSAGAYGAAYQTKAAKDAAEKARKQKVINSIADFEYKGRLNDAKPITEYYQKNILDYAAKNIDDPLLDIELNKRFANLKAMHNFSVELKDKAKSLTEKIMTNSDKNYYPLAEQNIPLAMADIPADVWASGDISKIGEQYGNMASMLDSIKEVPKTNWADLYTKVQNFAGNYAKDNMQGRSWQFPEKVKNDYAASLVSDPVLLLNYTEKMKSDPIGAKLANNDPYQYGLNDVKKYMDVKGFSPEPKGMNVIVNTGSGDGKGVATDAYTGKTLFGSGDNVFSTETTSVSFPSKQAVTNVPDGTFNPANLQTIKGGTPAKITYGSFDIIPTLDEDIDLGNGEKIPKGTPVPKGASIGDIVKIWVGSERDKYRGNGVVGYYLDAPKGAGQKPKTDLGIFAVGVDDQQRTYNTPFTKVAGALQGGLSKDDQSKFDQQFRIITDLYKELGGGRDYSPTKPSAYTATTKAANTTTNKKKKAY